MALRNEQSMLCIKGGISLSSSNGYSIMACLWQLYFFQILEEAKHLSNNISHDQVRLPNAHWLHNIRVKLECK